MSMSCSLSLSFFIRTHNFPFTVGDVPNGFAETDLADRIQPLVSTCVCAGSRGRRLSSGRQRLTLFGGYIIQAERRGVLR